MKKNISQLLLSVIAFLFSFFILANAYTSRHVHVSSLTPHTAVPLSNFWSALFGEAPLLDLYLWVGNGSNIRHFNAFTNTQSFLEVDRGTGEAGKGVLVHIGSSETRYNNQPQFFTANVVDQDGGAYLITAPKGTSKATILQQMKRGFSSWKILFGLGLLLFAIATIQRSNLIFTFSAIFFVAAVCVPYDPFDFTFGKNLSLEDQALVKDTKLTAMQRLTEFLLETIETKSKPISFPDNVSSGQLPYEVFAIDSDFGTPTIREKLFGGKFLKLQMLGPKVLLVSLFCWLLFLITTLPLRARLLKASLILNILLIASAALISGIFSIYYSMGWDELFVNLKHSYNLRYHGVYSCNQYSLCEGTVDFLPYLLATGLSFSGLDLVSSIILVSIFGNFLVIYGSFLISKKLTASGAWACLIAGLMGLYPSLSYMGASGFTAPFFTGWIFISLALIFLYERTQLLGLILLGALTLVRTEGFALTLLIGAIVSFDQILNFVKNKNSRIKSVTYLFKIWGILVSPFLLSGIIRLVFFGNFLPNPIYFKNTSGNLSYIRTGLDMLIKSLNAAYIDYVVIILFALSFFIAKDRLGRKYILQIYTILVCIFIFCLSYYSGGGDWFPIHWSRYLMPFVLSIYLAAMIASVKFAHTIFNNLKISNWISICLILGAASIWRSSIRPENIFYNGFFPDSILGEIAPRWQRVEVLARFGEFMKATTEKDTAIASAELATIMYFADRDIYDLLGTLSPKISRSPLNPMGPDDLIHRKRNPEALRTDLPGIIAPFEMAREIKSEGPTTEDLTQINNWLTTLGHNQFYVDIAYYRMGSFEKLLAAGYHPISILYKDFLFNYFVHERILAKHKSFLKDKGLVFRGVTNVSYKVSQEISQRFSQ